MPGEKQPRSFSTSPPPCPFERSFVGPKIVTTGANSDILFNDPANVDQVLTNSTPANDRNLTGQANVVDVYAGFSRSADIILKNADVGTYSRFQASESRGPYFLRSNSLFAKQLPSLEFNRQVHGFATSVGNLYVPNNRNVLVKVLNNPAKYYDPVNYLPYPVSEITFESNYVQMKFINWMTVHVPFKNIHEFVRQHIAFIRLKISSNSIESTFANRNIRWQDFLQGCDDVEITGNISAYFLLDVVHVLPDDCRKLVIIPDSKLDCDSQQFLRACPRKLCSLT
uniref:Uncharacterized protein n=1 Tax=Panagrolaimus sp. JU765 TaxID=591449 RepID=A0AC34RQ69_9BILA